MRPSELTQHTNMLTLNEYDNLDEFAAGNGDGARRDDWIDIGNVNSPVMNAGINKDQSILSLYTYSYKMIRQTSEQSQASTIGGPESDKCMYHEDTCCPLDSNNRPKSRNPQKNADLIKTKINRVPNDVVQ